MRVAVSAAALLACACTRSIADSGSTCELNSDCRAPLVCAAEACRPQCRTARDCARDETCVTYGDTGVCVPPSSAVPCAYASECGAGRTCASGTCRAACTSDADCGGGDHCAMGACAAPVTTPPAADAGTPDGAACAGTLCGARCVDTTSDPEHCGSCGNACAPGVACTSGACTGALDGDTCEHAARLELMPGLFGGGRFDPAGASDDSPSCSPGVDRFYAFELGRRSLVGMSGGPVMTTFGFLLGGCAAPPECDTTVAATVLEAGPHLVVVDDADLSVFNFGVEAVEVGDVDARETYLRTGTPASISGTTAGLSDTPGSCAPGPDHTHWWFGDGNRWAFHARLCGLPGGTLQFRANGEAAACASTPDPSCANGVSLDGMTSVFGLNVVTVDSAAGPGGAYTLDVTLM